jgi:5-formyltetrahydrofolate cyclo-ligase
MTDPTAAKAALRSTMRQLRRAVPDQAGRSGLLFAAVAALDQLSRAEIVMVYEPLPGEPDPSSLVVACQRRGVQVVQPQSNRPDLGRAAGDAAGAMVELIDGLPPGRHPDVVLVPGLAFTAAGDRLGQGGGWYDALLTALPATTFSIGVCWSVQLLDQLFLEPHDRRLDAVVTEDGLVQLPS